MTAITSYATLITNIGENLHRTDVASAAAEWITDAETAMNYGLDLPNGVHVPGLRVGAQETITTLNCAAGTQTVALPTGLLEIRKLYITIGGYRQEISFSPTLPMGPDERSNVNSIPWRAIITGSNLYLIPIPNDAYVLTIDYYTKIGPLTSGTNWLLTQAPDVYRSGAIYFGSAWLGPNFDESKWLARFVNGLNAVQNQDMSRFDMVTARTDPALIARGNHGFNIYMGW